MAATVPIDWMQRRLLKETGVGEGEIGGLFDALLTPEDHGALLAEAYRRMARKKAFRRDPGNRLSRNSSNDFRFSSRQYCPARSSQR